VAEDVTRTQSGYDAFYGAWGWSKTFNALWRDLVTGPDDPDDYAHISFVSLADLRRLADGLQVDSSATVADLACGAGGPGLWVSHETGARLVGIDLSSIAVEVATRRADALGFAGRATFHQGTFAATRLDDASVDAVMTIDALQYAPSKQAAIDEMARIVRPGGRAGIIAFELDPARVAGMDVWDDPVADYRPLLSSAGFDVLEHRQIEGWEQCVRRGFSRVVELQETLTAELGEPAAAALVLEAAITLELEPYCGHAFVLAVRR
jgi:SAM-dependent methyltransferase